MTLSKVQNEVYESLLLNPLTSAIVKSTGRSKFSVAKALNILIKKKYIKRISKGLYKPLKRKESKPAPVVRVSESDHLRLHNLQVELLVSSSVHNTLRSYILKRKVFKNIHSSGNNGGHYFDHGHISYMVTRSKVFAMFPANWEINGVDLPDLSSNMYSALSDEFSTFESRYKTILFKDGRINFNIRNMHIALVRNGLVKEFKKNNINGLYINDSEDGKPRFLMDFSHGLAELEAVHPEHAFVDADRAQLFMHSLKDGRYETMLDNSETFFDTSKLERASELLVVLNKQTQLLEAQTKENLALHQIVANLSKQITLLANGQVRAQAQIESVATELVGTTKILSALVPTPLEKESKTRPGYFG